MTEATALTAILILLGLLAFAIWTIAKLCSDNESLRDFIEMNDPAYDAETIRSLREQLAEATKNDTRDPKTGRYVSHEDVCVNPASYPAKR